MERTTRRTCFICALPSPPQRTRLVFVLTLQSVPLRGDQSDSSNGGRRFGKNNAPTTVNFRPCGDFLQLWPAPLPERGVLRFADADWPLIGDAVTVNDVSVMSSKKLKTLLAEPGPSVRDRSPKRSGARTDVGRRLSRGTTRPV